MPRRFVALAVLALALSGCIASAAHPRRGESYCAQAKRNGWCSPDCGCHPEKLIHDCGDPAPDACMVLCAVYDRPFWRLGFKRFLGLEAFPVGRCAVPTLR